MELREFTAVLWRRKWLLLIATLLAAASAFVISRLMTPVYEASTTLLIDQAPASRAAEYSAIIASERGTRTYAELLTKRPVIEETLTRLELGVDVGEIHDVSVQLVPDTQLIELKVQHANPIFAAMLANTIVEVFTEQNDAFQASRFAASKASLSTQLEKISEQVQASEAAIDSMDPESTDAESPEIQRLQAELAQNQASYIGVLQSYEELRLAEAQSFSNIIQVEPAEPPTESIRPRIVFNTIVAGVIGGMLALAIVFLIEYLDDSIKTPQDVSRATRLPVVGYVARSKKLAASGTRQSLMISEPKSGLAESFRSIRTNIELAAIQGIPRSILLSSPGQGDGKTTVAAQLAVSMAQAGKRVVLVDANLRWPRLHQYFSVENESGLSDMLIDDLVPQIVARESIHWRLKVITSGRHVDNPAELMASIQMLKVLSRIREQADVAIFDSPPFIVADAFILASKLESVLVVMDYGRTREAVVKPIMDQLERAHVDVLGVVMNRAPVRIAHGLSGNLTYGSSQQPGAPNHSMDELNHVKEPNVFQRQPHESAPQGGEEEVKTELHN